MSDGEAHVRLDPLTGARVVVVPGRQGRPDGAGGGCPFCPGGLEAPDPYRTRWFANRWPPLPDGRAEVVLHSPDHAASFADLSPAHAEEVVALWADRTASLMAQPGVAYVLVFENRGREVGATVDHPHSQIYALGEVPPTVAAELPGPCALCAEQPGARLVGGVGGWRAWVPAAATWPYELRIAPTRHVADLPAALAAGSSPAAVLGDCVGRLDRLFAAPMPYMLWWHQGPAGAHVHAHLAPLLRAPGVPRFVAAGELGSGVHFNPVDPGAAAEALRAAGPPQRQQRP